MFTLNMLKGQRDALKDPSSILISASTAKAFFGNDDPMFKVLKLNNQDNLKVAGVYAGSAQELHACRYGLCWFMGSLC